MFPGFTHGQEDGSCNGSQAETCGFIYPAVNAPRSSKKSFAFSQRRWKMGLVHFQRFSGDNGGVGAQP